MSAGPFAIEQLGVHNATVDVWASPVNTGYRTIALTIPAPRCEGDKLTVYVYLTLDTLRKLHADTAALLATIDGGA